MLYWMSLWLCCRARKKSLRKWTLADRRAAKSSRRRFGATSARVNSPSGDRKQVDVMRGNIGKQLDMLDILPFRLRVRQRAP
mmetsp:Transcript_58397/g.152840  ORF Transcript_58397/g.152840 Transcript_58397/m.152840 type:complete len:82 (-) Transcript_58397:483-728(-)